MSVSDGKFYVYEHWRTDQNVCFYVGKGQKRRAWNMQNGRNMWHHNIAKKLGRNGIDVRIIADNLDEKKAFEIERAKIVHWRGQGITLVNLGDGGEGASGAKWSEESKRRLSQSQKGKIISAETRLKLSAANKGQIAAFKGKKHTPETIRILVQKAKERGPPKLTAESFKKIAAANIGRFVSQTTRAKISAALKGRPGWAKGTPSKLRGRQLSEDTKRKMSAGAKAKWEKQKASGWSSPRIGSKMSDEAREKMRFAWELRRAA